ncbi:MAG TPA: hypothetical protein VLD67_22495 [Vicinamibacterales bacterium]|nr:hypothetical protein [Vicinamibacterales bacterium]
MRTNRGGRAERPWNAEPLDLVRGIRLRRRRSRVPWIYSVYHVADYGPLEVHEARGPSSARRQRRRSEYEF